MMIKKYNIIISFPKVVGIYILIIICVSCIDDVNFGWMVHNDHFTQGVAKAAAQ